MKRKRKKLLKSIKVERGEWHHFIWGFITAIFGSMIASVVSKISGFYNEYFFISWALIYSFVIQHKYTENWSKFWNETFRKKSVTKK